MAVPAPVFTGGGAPAREAPFGVRKRGWVPALVFMGAGSSREKRRRMRNNEGGVGESGDHKGRPYKGLVEGAGGSRTAPTGGKGVGV